MPEWSTIWAAVQGIALCATAWVAWVEGIAIAAEQGFYVERIVRDHLEPMMRNHVREFLVGC